MYNTCIKELLILVYCTVKKFMNVSIQVKELIGKRGLSCIEIDLSVLCSVE